MALVKNIAIIFTLLFPLYLALALWILYMSEHSNSVRIRIILIASLVGLICFLTLAYSFLIWILKRKHFKTLSQSVDIDDENNITNEETIHI